MEAKSSKVLTLCRKETRLKIDLKAKETGLHLGNGLGDCAFSFHDAPENKGSIFHSLDLVGL